MNSIFAATIRASLQMAILVCLWLPLASVAAVYSGTGFFISEDGYIATNYHVIDGAEEIRVRDGTGNVLKASVVLRDRANDLAVIKVSGRGFSALPTRSSADIKKGSAVFTLGFPNATIQGREIKATEGIVSSLSGIRGEPNSFQISVPIQPGNSGGPLIDMTGAVVGITTAKLSAESMLKNGGTLPENVNYAVKSNYLLELIGTDRNVGKHVIKSTSQKGGTLTALIEKTESAIVFIVVSTIAEQDVAPSSNDKSEAPRQQEGSNQIIARVNGRPIPRAAFLFLIEQSVKQGKADDYKLQAEIKEKLIIEEVVAIESSRRGIGTLPDPKIVVSAVDAQSYLAQRAILIRTYLQDFIKNNPLNDDALKADYNKIKSQLGDKEYHVRHILVEKEAEAKDIISRLQEGESFEKLAEKSKDPGSKVKGGDLGWAAPANFVPEFSAVMTKLPKGQFTTEPVKSQFGWHIIKLEDSRAMQAPPLRQCEGKLA